MTSDWLSTRRLSPRLKGLVIISQEYGLKILLWLKQKHLGSRRYDRWPIHGQPNAGGATNVDTGMGREHTDDRHFVTDPVLSPIASTTR